MAERKTYRILSLDGGGIRGLIPAIWLDRLEKMLDRPLWRHFDLVAGTSTGAILACAVAAGIDTRRIIDLYSSEGHRVFPSPRRLARFFRGPKYDGRGLVAALDDVFDAACFGELNVKPTLVTTYDTFTGKPVIFKSDRPRHQKLLVRDVCRASSAAPTYFPPHVLKVSGAKVPLIDGGVVANNPTACAIAEAVRASRRNAGDEENGRCLGNLLVASFGTGDVLRRISGREAQRWGTVRWAVPIIDVLFGASSDAVDYIARQLVPQKNFFRFQIPLDHEYERMDNASPENIDVLTHLATHHIDSGPGRRQLEELVQRLAEAD
ncbi:MAG: patatin-like phospholipase family protein [Planctomycetota bacterium]